MSQSKEKVGLSIQAFITFDDHDEPQAVTVTGYGNIPRGGVRSIAAEALESYFGAVNHGYRVQLTPEFEGDEETEGTVFEVYKSMIGTRKYPDFTGTPVNE
jgi:hypothetical protein